MAGAKKTGARNIPLPILASDEDLRNNPKMTQLLNILSNKISGDGTSVQLRQEIEQAEINLSQARFSWLMSHVPFYELRELLTDFEIRSIERMLSPEEEQFKNVLSQALATNEVEDYLTIYSNPTTDSTLFGLTQADVERHNPVKHLLPAVQQAVLPMLEERLRNKCEELYDFFSTSSEVETVSDKLLLAKAQNLPRLVEEKQQQLFRDKVVLKETRAQKNEHFLLYYQTLLECLSLMESLVKDFKFQSQTETDHIQVKSLEAQSAAVVLKARTSQLQVISDTYSADNVKALKVVENHLAKAIQRSEKELASTQQALNAYHTLGTDFKLLVHEYTKLKTEIDNCKWGLQQFLKADKKSVDAYHQGLDALAVEYGGITLKGAGPSNTESQDEFEALQVQGAFGGSF